MANRRSVLKAGAAGLLSALVPSWSYGQTVPSVLGALRAKQFSDLLPNPLDPANLFSPDAPGAPATPW